MNKLSAAIALAAVTQVTSLHAGVFSFLKGKGKAQGGQVSTGAGSKAEAKVDKNGSIVRVGSNTSAKVGDNGTVTLSKGVMLVSSGEGFLRRPPVQISTPQGDVTVRGSAIVAALPDGSVKMTVLEGNAKGMMGDRNMNLHPGQLMIQRHESRDAVKVDLGALASSSTLLDSSQYQLPLPAAPVIRQEAIDQAQAIGSSLSLSGAGQGGANQVVKSSELKMAPEGSYSGAVVSAARVSGATLQLGSPNSTPGLSPTFSGVSTIAGSSGGSLSVSGSNIIYSPGTTPTGVITDGSGNALPGAGSIRLSQTLVPEGTMLPPNPATPTISSGTISGVYNQVSGSSIRVSGSSNYTSAASISSGTLVLAPGSTQTGDLVINGTTGITSASVVTGIGNTATLVKTGGGILTIGNASQVTGGTTVLTTGTLVLRDGAALQFLNGQMTVTGPGGVVLTPTNDGGVLTFQAPGTTATGTTPAGGN